MIIDAHLTVLNWISAAAILVLLFVVPHKEWIQVCMTLANLSILKTGKARAIRFSTLEAICEALACQPGDLVHFEQERTARRAPAAMKRSAAR